MSFQIQITRRAQKALARLPKRDYQRVKEAIFRLADEPRPPGCKKLTGREGWRLRVGRYRILYEITEATLTIIVLDMGHRRDIYR